MDFQISSLVVTYAGMMVTILESDVVYNIHFYLLALSMCTVMHVMYALYCVAVGSVWSVRTMRLNERAWS